MQSLNLKMGIQNLSPRDQNLSLSNLYGSLRIMMLSPTKLKFENLPLFQFEKKRNKNREYVQKMTGNLLNRDYVLNHEMHSGFRNH